MTTSTRACGVLLALTCLAGVSACADDGPSGGSGGDDRSGGGDSKGVGDDFPAKDVIISAGCKPATKGEDNWYGGVVSVDGWEPGSWKHVAHTEFRLPDRAISGQNTDDTALTGLCQPSETGEVPSMRSLFDRDFTKIAVVTLDAQTEETHVGYVDRKGKFTDLTGESEFGEDPTERVPAFSPDGDRVWLIHGKHDGYFLASRSVGGSHELVGHGKVEDDDMITMVGSPNKVVVSQSRVTLSPDGKHLSVGSAVVPTPEEEVFDATSEPDDLMKDSQCSPHGWIDDETLLCSEFDNYSTADLAPDAKQGKPLLPENSETLFTMALSPDREKVTFMTEEGDRYDHWVSGLEPGSKPEKIDPGSDFAKRGGDPVIIDWR